MLPEIKFYLQLKKIILEAEEKKIKEIWIDKFKKVEEESMFKTAEYLEEYEKWLSQLANLIDNAKIVDCFDKCKEAEKTVLLDLGNWYNLKCKFDSLEERHIADDKSASTLTKKEEVEEKYFQQIALYQYAYFKKFWEKKKGLIREFKKSQASLPTKKEELIALMPEDYEGIEALKVKDMKDYLKAHPKKERISQEIEFEWDDKIIDFCEDLLTRSVKKANWLKTLSIEDVL